MKLDDTPSLLDIVNLPFETSREELKRRQNHWPEKERMALAIMFCKRVEKHMNKKTKDALAIIERYLAGNATDEELQSAKYAIKAAIEDAASKGYSAAFSQSGRRAFAGCRDVMENIRAESNRAYARVCGKEWTILFAAKAVDAAANANLYYAAGESSGCQQWAAAVEEAGAA